MSEDNGNKFFGLNADLFTDEDLEDIASAVSDELLRRVKPKEATYTGECWAYHYDNMEPTFAHFNVSDICKHGTYTATHVNGKPTRIVWEADQ